MSDTDTECAKAIEAGQTSALDNTKFTIIIPAHNEAAVIARCLDTVMSGAPVGNSTQIIVAANGCTDDTVKRARKACPQITILDLEEGSKPKAMNAAHARASYYPRIFLDADVQCDYHSLFALTQALRSGKTMAASPAIRMDLSRSSSVIKSYYRVWLSQPYVTNNMVGSGCYGISRQAHEAIGPFPEIIGDDIWVHSRFAESERANVSHDENGQPVYFTVSPPTRAIDQIRIETRRRLGNEEMRRLHPSPHYSGSNTASDLRLAFNAGANVIDIAIYLTMKLLARARAKIAKRRGPAIVWERDLGARDV